MKMKKLLYLLLIPLFFGELKAQPRPDICPGCVMDTTGGYVSIDDVSILNPVCNYELLCGSRLSGEQQNRDTIRFFPYAVRKLYHDSGYAMGHVIPFQDLAYSPSTAKASMNLNRNLAPQPQNENIGTKLACEDTTRLLAREYGCVAVYAGTYGSYGSLKGINIPSYYWTLIITPAGDFIYWMPTHGNQIGYKDLKDCHISYAQLIAYLHFDPVKAIPYARH